MKGTDSGSVEYDFGGSDLDNEVTLYRLKFIIFSFRCFLFVITLF